MSLHLNLFQASFSPQTSSDTLLDGLTADELASKFEEKINVG